MYALENLKESERLDYQNTQKQYRVKEELRFLSDFDFKQVLDAGCGSGAVTKSLLDAHPYIEVSAFDQSEVRIAQAKGSLPGSYRKKVRFSHGDLNELPFTDASFDLVICRFAYEYLESPEKVTQEFHRVLKPGGVAYLIDLDGLHLNTWTANTELNDLIKELNRHLSVDLCVGRKLRSFLFTSQFKSIRSVIDTQIFQSKDDIDMEHKNNEQRFHFARKTLEAALGSTEQAEKFERLYLNEMSSEGTEIFFNKFITWGIK